jgi:hypothetical protein
MRPVAAAACAPVTAFSVIEGFTDLRLTYLTGLSAGLSPEFAAIASGAFQPGVSFYLPDANGVMGYNWRSAHYFASRGDLSIQKFKAMPILILHGNIDASNPVPLEQPAEISADIQATFCRPQWRFATVEPALHRRARGRAAAANAHGAEQVVPDLVHADEHRRSLREWQHAAA